MSKTHELIKKTNLKRDHNKLYIIDDEGDISEIGICGLKSLKPVKYTKPKKVKILGIKKEEGYLYFIGKNGDVYRNQINNK